MVAEWAILRRVEDADKGAKKNGENLAHEEDPDWRDELRSV